MQVVSVSLVTNIVLRVIYKIIRFKTRFAGKFKGFKSSKAMPLVTLNPVFFKNRQPLGDTFIVPFKPK